MEKREEVLNCRIPKGIKDTMKSLAQQFDLSLSDIVVKLLRKGINDIGYSEHSIQTVPHNINQKLLK
jgi:hypothetical protein